jgi:hypothetical protein
MKAKFLLAKVTLSFCRCTSRTRPNWWKYPFSNPLSLLACVCAALAIHGQPYNQCHLEHAGHMSAALQYRMNDAGIICLAYFSMVHAPAAGCQHTRCG